MDILIAAALFAVVAASTAAWATLELGEARQAKFSIMRFRTLNRQITVQTDIGVERSAFDDWVHRHRREIDRQDCLETCSQVMDQLPGVLAVECWHASGHIGTAVRNGRY
jgi:hypothetical protein